MSWPLQLSYTRAFGLAIVGVFGLATPTIAQDWPRRPIKFVVPQSPGSTADIIARLLAQNLNGPLGQVPVVDNRAGAGGVLGADIVAKAPPDGYTFLIANPSTHGIASATYKKLPFDPIKDFAPVSRLADTEHVIVTGAEQPFKTLKEMIAGVKAAPDKFNYGTSGHGSSHHLSAALLVKEAGDLNMLHVPFKGTGPMLTATLAGDVLWSLPAKPGALGQIRGGKLRALAATGPKRAPELPDIPAVNEVVPGFQKVTWFGLAAPAGTPPAIIAQMNAGVVKALDSADARKALDAAGLVLNLTTPDAMAAHVAYEIDKWAKAAKAADFKPE